MKKKDAWLLIFPSLFLYSFFFLEIAKLGFYGQRVFELTPLKFLLARLLVNDQLIDLPLATRILAGMAMALPLFASYQLFRNRNHLFFGFGMLLASLANLGAYFSIQLLSRVVGTTEGLGHLMFIPKEGLTVSTAVGIFALVTALWIWNQESFFEYLFLGLASVAVLSVGIITVFMFIMGAPAIAEIGPFEFLFQTVWKPTAASPQFGIGAMILTTIFGTLGAILVGAPIGILTGVFLAEIAPPWLVKIVRPAVDLLAGIPSVIYGFFGMVVILPLVRDLFHVPVGDSLFSVIVILCIMILPTIIGITETSIRAVPSYFKEASLGLGATQIQTIFKIILPAARSGILAAVILGVGRAVGETMAIIMVAGNVVNLPQLLAPVRPMTAGIVLEMAYSADLHRQALFAIGLVLFVFIMLINFMFTYFARKVGEKYEA